MSCRGDERRVLRVGDLAAVYVEGRLEYSLLWSRIRQPAVSAHHESAGGNVDHTRRRGGRPVDAEAQAFPHGA